MSPRKATIRAVLTAAMSAALVVGTLAASPASASRSVPTGLDAVTPAAGTAAELDLQNDGVVPPNARSGFRKWTLTRLYYYESLPAKWDWSLSTAVAKWNSSGGRIKFVRTPYKRKAKLLISYGDTGGSAARATLGATAHPWVRLSNRFKAVDAYGGYPPGGNRTGIMSVLAHELGHVLGFSHTAGNCSLMYPTNYFTTSACGGLPLTQPGHYKCQVIDRTLVRRFISIYGGAARYAPGYCALERVPPPLAITFNGGNDSAVTASWIPPSGAPTTWRVWITHGDAKYEYGELDETCPKSLAQPQAGGSVAASGGSWTDANSYSDQVPRCFRARLVNRYGAGAPGTTQVLTRYAWPPQAPQIKSNPTLVTAADDSGDVQRQLRFSASSPPAESTWLFARWGPTGSCPTSATAGEPLDIDDDATPGYYRAPVPDKSGCLVLFAKDLYSQKVSQGSNSVTWSVPAPTETLAMTSFVQDEYGDHQATINGLVAPHKVLYQVVAGSCASASADPATWEDTQSSSDKVIDIYSYDQGTNCAMFVAAEWDQYSPHVLKQEFTQRAY